MKKRALALALAGAMTASLTACGTYQNSGTETTKAAETTTGAAGETTAAGETASEPDHEPVFQRCERLLSDPDPVGALLWGRSSV